MKKQIAMMAAAFVFTAALPVNLMQTAAAPSFTDVPEDSYYAEAAAYCLEKELMDGTGGGLFSPDVTTDRAMTATVLFRADGSPSVSYGVMFDDVPEGRWYSDAVSYAAEKNIVSGYGDGNFGPSSPVTRQDLVTMLYRHAKLPTVPSGTELSFTDAASIADYAQTPVKWASALGIVKGKDGGRFDPKGLCTRAELATFIHRYLTAETLTVTAPDNDESYPGVKATLAAVPDEDYGDDAAAFFESDAIGKWVRDQSERRDASIKVQDGMDAYYNSLAQFLTGDGDSAVFSPLNLYLALSMVAECADGDTRTQILDVLKTKDLGTLRERNDALWMANYANTPVFKSLLANSIWMRDDIDYHQDVIDTLANRYHASSFSGVMGSEDMNKALRTWTDRNTGNLLKEYTAEMKTESDTVMELVSTLYYKATWLNPFYKGATTKETFHGLNGDVPCDMMHASGTDTYYRGKSFGAVARHLSDSGSMFFFLPDEGSSVDDILKDPAALSIVRDPLGYEDASTVKVELSVPRFKVSAQTDLPPLLKSLGMTDAFDLNKADFTPLATLDENIYISRATHAAMVEIDEEGVTGAAFTDFGMTAGSAMPPDTVVVFTLDRPFLFVITGTDDSILFAGTVKTIK